MDRVTDRAANLSAKINGWTGSDPFRDRAFFAGDHLLRAAGAMAG